MLHTKAIIIWFNPMTAVASTKSTNPNYYNLVKLVYGLVFITAVSCGSIVKQGVMNYFLVYWMPTPFDH